MSGRFDFSVMGTATGLWTGRSGVRIPARERNFFVVLFVFILICDFFKRKWKERKMLWFSDNYAYIVEA
jgi:hypothetical protein